MITSGIFRIFSRSKKVKRMKILLVDDHTILLDGVKSLLSQEDDLAVVGQAASAEEALEFLKKNEVDLIITDYSMPGMDGLSLLNTVKRVAPHTKIILLSMHDEVHLVKEILKAGVNGYVLKNDTHKELLNAIHDVRRGKVYLSSDVNKMLITNLNNPDEGKLLTDREREILKLIAKEYTNKDIAEELFISERTVETHRKNIFKKTGTNSLVGLIKFAYANNLI
ncbi:MAG: response regulator transcription factor [Cyclobacteriaceae bacterium]|nr:response regulator transcription factor [Cyclobacteriaceae bacterium]